MEESSIRRASLRTPQFPSRRRASRLLAAAPLRAATPPPTPSPVVAPNAGSGSGAGWGQAVHSRRSTGEDGPGRGNRSHGPLPRPLSRVSCETPSLFPSRPTRDAGMAPWPHGNSSLAPWPDVPTQAPNTANASGVPWAVALAGRCWRWRCWPPLGATCW